LQVANLATCWPFAGRRAASTDEVRTSHSSFAEAGWSLAWVPFCFVLSLATPRALGAENSAPPGFIALFDGRELSGWKVPEGDNGPWKVLDGVID